MNTAIIVAAGSGLRFAFDTQKQFVPILGKPLIIHTLERFEACAVIDQILLVLSETGRSEFERFYLKYQISKLKSIVIGGPTRAESVKNGLDAVDAATANIIAIHDGARPLVSVNEITRTVQKAAETGAACLVAQVTDTIKEIDGEFLLRTLDRSCLRRALTPQAFRYDIIKRAFDESDVNESITDECFLVERLGYPISCVEGSSINIKITHKSDLAIAEAAISFVGLEY